MSYPQVSEAVAFGCPDEKYGEIVAAAIVPNNPVSDTAAFAKDIQKQSGQKMAAFKVRSTHSEASPLVTLQSSVVNIEFLHAADKKLSELV